MKQKQITAAPAVNLTKSNAASEKAVLWTATAVDFAARKVILPTCRFTARTVLKGLKRAGEFSAEKLAKSDKYLQS